MLPGRLILWLLAACTVAALSALSALWLAPAPGAIEIDARHCDLAHGPCAVELDGARLSAAVHGPVRSLVPFIMEADIEGARVEAVSVRFDMPGMEMGFNRHVLQPAGESLWRGRVILPLCTDSRVDWQASVEIRGVRNYRVTLRLTVD